MVEARAKGRLFIISAPSGSGKTTLCKSLLAENIGLVPSVSATTRKPRPGEKDKTDYIFISKKRFMEMVKAGQFLEYEENFSNLYGTPRRFIQDSLRNGRSVLLSIDVKGAMKVRRAYPRESILIFILPPSIKALKKRLLSRMADAAETISTRLKLARREIAFKDRYDYRIVNDKLSNAYRRLKKIIISEMAKVE